MIFDGEHEIRFELSWRMFHDRNYWHSFRENIRWIDAIPWAQGEGVIPSSWS